MELRIIAAASLVALAAQGCYRPMYSTPYGYPSQGYPVGSGYPGSIQTIPPGQPYAPGTSPQLSPQPGGTGVPTYPPTYSPTTTGPAAAVPVPTPRDAAQFQPPVETQGGRELGFNPAANDFLRTAGTAPMAAEPNAFAPANPAPIAAQPTFADPAPTPATVTSDNFQGGNSPTTFN
jgi:hypothetical protein